MAERGKYHGQRLKAKEVLQLYAAGERDFRGAILRGCDFRGADLSGAEFIGADICSAQFVDAALHGTNFSHAMAGLQRWCWWGQLIVVGVTAAIAGLLQGFAGANISALFVEPDLNPSVAGIIIGVTSLAIVAIVFFEIALQGFTLKALGSTAITVSVAITIATIFSVIVRVPINADISISEIFAASIAVAGTIATVFAIAIAFTFDTATAIAVAVPFASTFTSHFAGPSRFAVPVAVSFTIAFTVASLLLSIYINHCIHRGNAEFENLRIIGFAFAALGSTTFSGVDLTEATFAHAHLKSSNFADSRQRPMCLTRVRWHGAEKLDRARLGTSNLQDPRVRQLVTTLNDIEQDLSDADLRGTNLAGAKLHRAHLKGVNLNGATLESAELHGANLTEAQCVGTDFTAAQLTAACLEAWNIDETTVLQSVDCQYVFLKEQANDLGWRERLPHNPDKCFEPGDFEKYFREVLDEVKILIRGGVDPQAFKAAFQDLMQKHQITPASVRSLQRRGPDVLMGVAVPPDQPKPEVTRTFDATYEKALPESTAHALLKAERRSRQDIIALANRSIDSISLVLSNLTINTIAMNQRNSPNITTGDGSFYAGGDVNLSGSKINLGEISGQVSNQINQLPDAAPDQPNLKDLLTQLQAAVETDTELSEVEKKEALGEVAKLAEAGSQPKAGTMQRMVKRATAALKSITEPLSDASKLATACKTLLPLILSVF